MSVSLNVMFIDPTISDAEKFNAKNIRHIKGRMLWIHKLVAFVPQVTEKAKFYFFYKKP